MGYEDNFYKKENIIGYTGEIKKKPTVYFADAGVLNPKTVTVNGKSQIVVKYGHITQAHDLKCNVGREEVGEAWSYSISNQLNQDGELSSHEDIIGKELVPDKPWLKKAHLTVHESRSKFERVTAGNIKVLAQAIKKFKEIKFRYEHHRVASCTKCSDCYFK